jgi:hypothetical protein
MLCDVVSRKNVLIDDPKIAIALNTHSRSPRGIDLAAQRKSTRPRMRRRMHVCPSRSILIGSALHSCVFRVVSVGDAAGRVDCTCFLTDGGCSVCAPA